MLHKLSVNLDIHIWLFKSKFRSFTDTFHLSFGNRFLVLFGLNETIACLHTSCSALLFYIHVKQSKNVAFKLMNLPSMYSTSFQKKWFKHKRKEIIGIVFYTILSSLTCAYVYWPPARDTDISWMIQCARRINCNLIITQVVKKDDRQFVLFIGILL